MHRKKVIYAVLFMLMLLCNVCSADIGRGDRGEVVLEVQKQLTALGFKIDNMDGTFDSQMENAIKSYQYENKLPMTGEINQEMYRKLMNKEMPDRFAGSGNISLIRRIIGMAMTLQGVPYVFGGTSPGGFDCSGFVQYVFRQAGLNLPRMADEQYYAVNKVRVPREGDLVFFETYTSGVSHVGVYIGDDKFVHASSSRGVTVSSLKEDYWSARYVGAGGLL